MTKEAEPYERPENFGITSDKIRNGTPEDFTRWRAEAAPVQERNTARFRARCDAKRAIEALIAQAWPRGSDEFKAITKALGKAPIISPQNYISVLNDMERDATRRREETTRKAAHDAEGARKLLAAGAFLAARGKVVGKDYEAHEALEIANGIAADEAIAAQKAEGGFISFGGDDTCERCSGWDMESHRCACGNRRVGWDSYGDFENMHVYAQAH